MKRSLKNCLLALLTIICTVCMAVGIAACTDTSENSSSGSGSDASTSTGDSSTDSSTSGSTEHNFSDTYTYDNVAHWYTCTDEGCTEISGYEEHTPTDDGVVAGGYVYYTCSVCGCDYSVEAATGLIYTVYVYNIGGAGVSGVDVTLYNESNTAVNTLTSGSGGIVRFRDLTAGNYTAIVDTSSLPAGYYAASEDDITLNLTATTRSGYVYITPQLITGTSEPAGLTYSLGSVVYDHTFTVYYTDGTSDEISFSSLLEDYDAIMLQFFYTTCNPCITEFPYISEVYNTYTTDDGSYYYEKVAILEIAYNGYDTFNYFYGFVTNTLSNSKTTTGYANFAYTYDTESYRTYFNVSAYPTTIMIDRYGVITSWEEGSNTTRSHWKSLFETYIGDDYTPDYVSSSSSDDDDTTLTKPDVEMPTSGEIANAIVTENNYTSIDGKDASDTGTFEFSAYYDDNGEFDEYSWPWLINTDTTVIMDGVTDFIYTSNANKLGTYSILVIDVKLEAGQVFMFDYILSTEADGDYLYIQVDKVLQAQLSGITTTWDTFYYVAQYSGYYQITLLYQKNTSTDEEGDQVYVCNMRVGVLDTAAQATDTANDILDSSSVLTTADMLYNAATAYTTDGTQSSYYAGTGYPNYVDVYLASDGWYRVDLDGDNKDGDDAEDTDPYLLADLYYTTPWNSTYAIWSIAYVYLYTYDYDSEDTSTSTDEDTSTSTDEDDEEIVDPTSGKGWLYNNVTDCETIEDYAWIQNVAPMGYTLVDSTLAELLKIVTKSYGTVAQEDNENQWLEVCRYYIHYGAEDKDHECKSLDNLNATYGIIMAVDVGSVSSANTEGSEFTFTAEMPEVINPRGFYYSFTVETEGVYLIYTGEGLHDVNGYEVDGETYGNDAYIWITDSTGHEIAENDDYDLNVYDENGDINSSSSSAAYYNDNCYIYCYLEKGTYMAGCTLSYIYDTGSYDVYIRYLGETYTYFTAAVSSDIYTYSYDEDTETYTYYLPYVFDSYYLDRDDNCYYAVEGTHTSPIYINMTGITYLNSSYSNYTLEDAINNGAWSSSSYDATIKDYLAEALSNTDVAADGTLLTGYVQATAELVNLLNAYINGGDASTDTTYASNAWLLTAYYVRVLDTYSAASSTVTDSVE